MMTDDELDALLHEAAGEFAIPAQGPAAILAAAAPPAPDATVVRGRFRWRELALAGTSVAAVVALTVVLATAQGSSPPVPMSALQVANGASSSGAASYTALAPTALKSPRSTVTSGKNTSATAAAAGREIIAKGTLRLAIIRAALRRDVAHLDALAAQLGGYVSAANVTETGSRPGGTVVVAVPASSFSSLIAKAEGIGKVKSLSTSNTDVTAQVVDLGARLTALVDERNQLEVLLGRAAKVSDLLAVENEIEYVQSQIEQIQGEQRTIASQVSFSSLTVDFVVPRPSHKTGSPNGFDHAWHEAISGFVNGVKALIAHLGDILFGVLSFIVAALIVFGLWRNVWPRVRRRIA
jgi:hypothetical protein